MEIKNKTISNFISLSEIKEFKNKILHIPFVEYKNPYTGNIDAKTKLCTNDAIDFFSEKIEKHFDKSVKIEHAHLLHSMIPYGIHSDVLSGEFDHITGGAYPDNRTPAWTFIIPLETYNSHTIVFNEISPYIKTVKQWAKENKVKPDKKELDDEFHQKYLSHEEKILLKFLTLDEVFKWEAGSLFASNRAKFHSSDNYIANGINEKQAIIMWTYIENTI